MIQVELPRYVTRPLFPPLKDFTPVEWWLSVLRHASEYTKAKIDNLAGQGIVMPPEVKIAFGRLDFSKWNPDQRREYALQVKDREEFETTYAVERAEGKAEGKAEGEKAAKIEIARGMLAKKMDIKLIIELTGLNENQINGLNVKK